MQQSGERGTFTPRRISHREDNWTMAATSSGSGDKEDTMLNLVVTLLIIALIAAVLGFGGIAGAAVGIAKIVFLVALVLFVVAALAGTIRTV